MINTTTRIYVRALILFLLGLCLSAPPLAKAAQHSPPLKRSWDKVEKIAVMPFLKGGDEAKKKEKVEKDLDCQLLGLCYTKEDLQSGAEARLTDISQKYIRNFFGSKVVPLNQVRDVYAGIPQTSNKTPRQLAITLGQKLMADYVMVGLVWRYRERVGGPMAVDSPASVAFSVYIVDVRNGQLAGKASFNRTQTSLAENLFDAPMFFKKGMKWLTARELANYGAKKILSNIFVK